MPEHVHLFIQVGPLDRPNDISKTLKSISAVHIFGKFPKFLDEYILPYMSNVFVTSNNRTYEEDFINAYETPGWGIITIYNKKV